MRDFLHTLAGQVHEGGTVLLIAVIVLLALVVGAVVHRVLRVLANHLRPARRVWSHGLLTAAAGPAQALVWVFGLALASELLVRSGHGPFLADSLFAQAVAPMRDVLSITIVVWFLISATTRIQANVLLRGNEQGREVDPTAADAIGKLCKAIIVILAILMVLQTFGFSIAGLLAFGGMGGIAVGFAAQSLVANLLGGLTIFASRPFKVGEYIIIPGTELSGGVEHIGWRATRLLGFDCKPFYVPNAMFNTQPVINHSRMTNRRIMEDIHVRYDDVQAIPAIVADTRAMLRADEGIQQDFFAFNFAGYGAYSLKLFLYAFTVTTDYNEYLDVQERVLLKLAEIIRQHGAELAGPASAVSLSDGDLVERLKNMPPAPILGATKGF